MATEFLETQHNMPVPSMTPSMVHTNGHMSSAFSPTYISARFHSHQVDLCSYTARKMGESRHISSPSQMSSTQVSPLTGDSVNQPFVTVNALLTCFIHLPYNLVFQDSADYPDNTGSYVPVFNFLITHPTHGLTLFDLGVRKVSFGRQLGAT